MDIRFEALLKRNMSYCKWQCRVYAYKWHLCYEDLLGDTFEKMCRYAHRFRYEAGDKGFCTWASFVIYSVCVDTYRGQRKQRLETDIENATGVGTRDRSYEDIEFLRDAIEYIERRWPQHVHLVRLIGEGFTFKEIEEMTGVHIMTLRGRVFKIRQEMIRERAKLETV